MRVLDPVVDTAKPWQVPNVDCRRCGAFSKNRRCSNVILDHPHLRTAGVQRPEAIFARPCDRGEMLGYQRIDNHAVGRLPVLNRGGELCALAVLAVERGIDGVAVSVNLELDPVGFRWTLVALLPDDRSANNDGSSDDGVNDLAEGMPGGQPVNLVALLVGEVAAELPHRHASPAQTDSPTRTPAPGATGFAIVRSGPIGAAGHPTVGKKGHPGGSASSEFRW